MDPRSIKRPEADLRPFAESAHTWKLIGQPSSHVTLVLRVGPFPCPLDTTFETCTVLDVLDRSPSSEAQAAHQVST